MDLYPCAGIGAIAGRVTDNLLISHGEVRRGYHELFALLWVHLVGEGGYLEKSRRSGMPLCRIPSVCWVARTSSYLISEPNNVGARFDYVLSAEC